MTKRKQQYDYNAIPDAEYFLRMRYNAPDNANVFGVGGGTGTFTETTQEENPGLYQQQLDTQNQNKFLNSMNENSNAMAGVMGGINNAITVLQDPNSSNAQKVFGTLGIGAASKIWEGDTSKVDNAIKDAQAQMQTGKNNLIQDASSVSGAMQGLKANSLMPRQRINFTPTYYNNWKELKGGKGGFWKNMATATLQGAANGSIGGPWGAAGGAIAGILGSVAGLFGRKSRYNKAMAKANERMNYMVNAARGFNMEQDFAEKAANQNLISNGINTQRTLDMANFREYGGGIDLSPNMMAMQQQKQDNDRLKALNQPFSLGLGNSFNQKMNMFPYGGNTNVDDGNDGDNDFKSENTVGETVSNLWTLGSNYLSNRMFADDYLTQQGDTLRYGNGLFTIDGTTDVSNRVFGVRNRGDYSPITSEGAPITSINKFVPYNAKYNTEANKHKTYLGIDKNGKIKVGGIDKFEEGDMITLTTSNYIKDFKQDDNGNTVYKQATERQDSRRKTPITIVKGDNGDIEGSLAVLTGKTGNIDEDKYMFGQAAGGRVLVTDDNGHYSVLAGSTESIIKQFRDFKKKYNLDYVNTINLDNGTFSNGLYTESGQMSKDALRDYDNLNTGGGNFMYFKDTTPKSPYGWRQYGSGYINGSGDTFGVNSVISTTSPTEGMLITDIHKPNPNYRRSEPSYSYKSKNGETYFIQKGSEDGHFKVFDSYGLHIKPQNVPNDVRSAVLDYAQSLNNNVVSPKTTGTVYDPYAEDKPVYSEEDLNIPYIENSQNNDSDAQLARNAYLDYYRKQEEDAKRRQEEGHITEDWYSPLLTQPNETIDSVGTNFADSSIANILNVPDSAIFAKPKIQQDTMPRNTVPQQDTVPSMLTAPMNNSPKEHIITDPRELDEIFASTSYYDPKSTAFWEQYRKTPESTKEPEKEEKKTGKSEDKGNKTKSNNKAYTPSQRYRGYGEVKALLGNEEDIKAFQRRAGIKVDGIVGNQTVTALQKMLNEHGYNLKEDGIYGEKSSAAYNDYMSKLYQQDKYDQGQYAYGGKIDPTDYALAVTKEALDAERAKAKQNTQTVIDMLYGDRHGEADNGNRYDFGGTMKNLPSEMQSYETGGTHEQNPYGGIQIGTDQQGNPNLVEQGEFRYGDYIFSDRIPVNYDTLFDFGLIASVPKKKSKKGQEKTYADYAKDLVNKTGDPNDPITKRTNDANLQRLANAEEYQKAAEQGQMALDDSLNEYKSALKNGQSPMYGSMKYNGMNGGANPMDASQLTNVNRSGTPMMAAYGGNLFKAGGTPVNRYKITPTTPTLDSLMPIVDRGILDDYADNTRAFNIIDNNPEWVNNDPWQAYDELNKYYDPHEIAALRESYGMQPQGGVDEAFVRALQTDLKNKGYYKGNIDGDFGPKSRAALDAMNGTNAWTPYNANTTVPTNTQFNGVLSKYNSSYTSKGRFAGSDAAQTAVEGMTNVHTTDPNSPQAPVENTGTIPPQTGQMADTTRWQFKKLPTQGKWATVGLNAIQAGADANGFTNPDFNPNFNDANRLERKGEASTFARTNAHIGGYQAPDITDIQSPLAQAAQQQQATNRALQNIGGGRNAAASIIANDYNAGQTMGDIVTKVNAQNAANRMAAAEINRGIDQFNAQSDNDTFKDNLNAQINGQQMNLNATQASNENRLRQMLYQDATNRQAHQNIVTNQNQMYNNVLNMIADQAARNEEWNLINSKHNQDFYFDPKTGGWEYKGDSGAYSKLNNALATIYPDMPMTGLSADVQKEWNNLLQSKGGQNITDDEIRWIVDMERNAQIEQKAKREHELKLAELNRANTAKANGGYISNKMRNKYTNFDYNAI